MRLISGSAFLAVGSELFFSAVLIVVNALVLNYMGALSLLAQGAPQPAFEVASIKPNKSGDNLQSIRPAADGIRMVNQPLRQILLWVYQVPLYRISGGPSWINTDRYDIEARTNTTANLDQMRVMMQTLLAERFKLALHRETRDVPIFELRIAKSGFKLQPLGPGGCLPFDPQKPIVAPGKTPMDYCGTSGAGRGTLDGSSMTMAELARLLGGVVGRNVADHTGITGQFRIHLDFADALSVAPPDPGATRPSIFTALEEQLGLRLDSSKGPVEMLVIDRVERPSEN